MSRKDMYQEVTNIIIEALENNVRPWVQPWGNGPALSMPLRHNGEPYNGINILILWAAAQKKGYSSPYWMTFKQAKELGGHVKKGEKASPVFYAGKLKIEDDEPTPGAVIEDGEKFIHYMKSYAVFNVAQIEGLPDRYTPAPLPVIEAEDMRREPAAEMFIRNTGADIRSGYNRAYFDPLADYIALPGFDSFKSAHGYYSTAFHELAHWTGHKSRLDRLESCARRSKEYGFEELIAEISAAFLCVGHGINTDFEGQHVSYIQAWIQLFKDDKKAIFRAASAAQKAADYLHGLQPAQPDDDPDGITAEDDADAPAGEAIEAAPKAKPEPAAYHGMQLPEPEPEQAPEIHVIEWGPEWQRIKLQITCTRNKFGYSDHLEIQSIAPERHPLPITETGYRSHFAPCGEIDAFGGPVETALMMLNIEAQATGWMEQQDTARQGSLF